MSSTSLTGNPLMVTARLRDKLKADSIKLWEPPFYDPTAKTPVNQQDPIKVLGLRFATELDLDVDDVTKSLFSLQLQDLEKTAEIQEFIRTGKATVRFKYVGIGNGKMTEEDENDASPTMATLQKIQICLSENNGKDLKNLISGGTGIPASSMKLICSGKRIGDHKLLDAQGVRNGSQVMVLLIPSMSQEALQDAENQFNKLKASAASRTKVYLEVELPEKEREALAIALDLHKRGRGAMKINDFSKGLIFLLEAESAYSRCQTATLNEVDNYAILDLDIAWCYLNLNSITELPDAERRLKKCEEALAKSNGKKRLGYLVAHKASFSFKAVLSARVHLLQAIVAYYLGHIEASRLLFEKVDGELKRLKVCDEKLTAVFDRESEYNLSKPAGFYKDVADKDSFFFIRERIKMQLEADSVEIFRMNIESAQEQLGVCDDGQRVNVKTFMQLQEKRFRPELSVAALRRANNDANLAIQLLGDESFIREIQATIETSEAPSCLDSKLIQELRAEFSSLRISNVSANTTIEEDLEAWEAFENTCEEEEGYVDWPLNAESQFLEEYKPLIAAFL